VSKVRAELRAELLKAAIRRKLHRELTDEEERMIELTAALIDGDTENKPPQNENPQR